MLIDWRDKPYRADLDESFRLARGPKTVKWEDILKPKKETK